MCRALALYSLHMFIYAFSFAVAVGYIAAGLLKGNIQFVFTQFVVGVEVEHNVPAFAAHSNHGFPVLLEGGFDNGHPFGLEVVCGDAGHELTSNRFVNSAKNRTLYRAIWPAFE